jgi:hypothetical protein
LWVALPGLSSAADAASRATIGAIHLAHDGKDEPAAAPQTAGAYHPLLPLAFLGRRPALAATLLYSAIAVAMTWPLALGLTRDVPWDLGDPVLNIWILGRNADALMRALGGDLAALRSFWDAGIFHPEPLALARSEHLLPQTLQALPVVALTGNVVLAYNALFLSTFVLSALGAFLLVRELTGSGEAAALAGLFYGFAPYRVEQLSHLQVLSSQWLPFALWGTSVYLRRGGWRPLLLAGASWLAQNLSCGYYLLFFSPFVAAYAGFETWRRRPLPAARPLGLFAVAAAVAALTLPFLLPYQRLKLAGELFRERSEVELFSADVWAFVTAPEALRVWGDLLDVLPRPEAALFPGLAPLLLAAIGVAAAFAGAASTRAAATARRRAAERALRASVLVSALATLAILAGAGGALSNLAPGVSVRSLSRAATIALVATALWLSVAGAARAQAAAAFRAPQGFFLLAGAAAFLLCLGPTIRAGGEALMPGPYALLYRYLPGFEGLRVPARFAMLLALCLAVCAGYGALRLQQRLPRGALCGAAAWFLLEATAAPLVMNDVWSDPGLRRPPARLAQADETPAIYARVAELPAAAVLIEFPFGSDPYELRYMFHALRHSRPLVNGFSGALPRSYRERRGALRNALSEPARAARALCETTATHAVVHEAAWGIPARGKRLGRWLEQNGARALVREGDDVLYGLRACETS